MNALPAESLLEDRLAIVGTSGSGKTYTAGVLLEKILHGKNRVIIIDPLGVWYGLRMMADGKTPSRFDVVIFGGRHGDLPLTENSGQVIGEAVATGSQSCIIDLSGIGTKAAERRFMLAFLTALYRNTESSPVQLVFDEADMWAPQVLLDKDGDAARLLGMMETVVRRGRVKGFVPWLITQRPAVLSKNVLSQIDGIIAMKLTSSQDRDAIGLWVEGQADKAQWRELYASLATMQRGEGIVWVPGRSIMKTTTFPAKVTFDSSRTPKRGEAVAAVALKPIDIGTLKGKLATVENEAKANDPKALRAEIARLKAESQKLSVAAAGGFTQADLDKAWVDAFAVGDEQGFARAVREVRDGLSAAVVNAINMFKPAYSQAVSLAAKPLPAASSAPSRSAGQTVEGRGIVPNKVAPPRDDTGGTFTAPQKKVLRSLLFWATVGHRQPTRAMVAGLAGYSPSSGGFNNLLGGLKTAGAIDYPEPGKVSVLPAAGYHDTMLRDEAKQVLRSTLSAPQMKIVEAIPPGGTLTRERLGDLTNYSPTSGGFNNLLGSLRSLDIISYPAKGSVALSDWAHEVLG